MWKVIAWIVGYFLGWLLGTVCYASGWSDITVRVENWKGSVASVGSGTLAAGDGETALVVTCRHIFREGVGQLFVERANHQRFPAKFLGTSRFNDIAALEIDDPGARTLRLAPAQAQEATLIGWGSTNEPWKQSGQFIEEKNGIAFYSFTPTDGDSGGGVFDNQGRFLGVAWGTTGDEGAVVPLSYLRNALAGPACERFWRQTSTKKANQSMFATPVILASAMMAQVATQPSLPDKGLPPAQPPAPRKTVPDNSLPPVRSSPQASPQGAVPYQSRSFAPVQQYESEYQQQYQSPQYQYVPQQQQQSYDLPVTIRLQVTPQIEIQGRQTQEYAPRAQIQQQQASLGGVGCYGGSYSAASYGLSSVRSEIAVPSLSLPLICGPSGCFTAGGLSRLGLVREPLLSNRSKFRLKVKSSFRGGFRERLGL